MWRADHNNDFHRLCKAAIAFPKHMLRVRIARDPVRADFLIAFPVSRTARGSCRGSPNVDTSRRVNGSARGEQYRLAAHPGAMYDIPRSDRRCRKRARANVGRERKSADGD